VDCIIEGSAENDLVRLFPELQFIILAKSRTEGGKICIPISKDSIAFVSSFYPR
jgi:hypothetical protein